MADAQSTRLLYWGSGSPPCWRVQLALEEKQLKYDARLLEFSKKEHKSEEVLALNPRGQLPTFKDGEVVINESLAAIIYLNETYPDSGNALLPALGTPARALAWQRLAEGAVLVEKSSAATRLYMGAKRSGTELDKEAFSKKIDDLKTELAIWDGYLAKTAYLGGPAFSLADVFTLPFFLLMHRFGANYDDFPHVAKYVAAMSERPSVQATWPPHWKDSPRSEVYKGWI